MNILINLPDSVADKLTDFCKSKNMSRAELVRTMICKLVGEPAPIKKKSGRPSTTRTTPITYTE